MNKYGAQRLVTEDGAFDSRGEYARWCELKLLNRAGAIENLERQREYELQPKFARNGRKVSAIRWRVDFTYTEGGRQIAEDFKGVETVDFKLKRALFLHHHPDVILRISYADGTIDEWG
jgi:hypothetical protein